jgi:dethiobiotin synthetase
MKINSKVIFVTGTDTEVGKTVLSLMLMNYFISKKMNPFYVKLVQTGCVNPYDKDSDALFIYNNIDILKDKDPAESVPYCFKAPKAPFFAARNENLSVDFNIIKSFVENKKKEFSPVICEAAGGIMVPLNKNMNVVDMIKPLEASVVVAARTGLGTINHTLLTLEALKTRKIFVSGVFLMDNLNAKGVCSQLTNENIEAIKKYSDVEVVEFVKKITDFKNPDPLF